MARNLDPKCQQCRRAGEKLFLKGERCFSQKCALVKRNYAPGQHGLKRQMRLSSYGIHLKEKQKVKRMYRLLERQFANYLHRAIAKQGNAPELFLQALETRLDNVVYRIGLAESRDQARQLVGHGHVRVNEKTVSIPSYAVRAGDAVAIDAASANAARFERVKKANSGRTLPNWLTFDPSTLRGTVQHLPTGTELPQDLQVQLIVEYYAR